MYFGHQFKVNFSPFKIEINYMLLYYEKRVCLQLLLDENHVICILYMPVKNHSLNTTNLKILFMKFPKYQCYSQNVWLIIYVNITKRV